MAANYLKQIITQFSFRLLYDIREDMSTEHALLYNEAPIIGQGVAKLKNTNLFTTV